MEQDTNNLDRRFVIKSEPERTRFYKNVSFDWTFEEFKKYVIERFVPNWRCTGCTSPVKLENFTKISLLSEITIYCSSCNAFRIFNLHKEY